jgi:hypothetical protein
MVSRSALLITLGALIAAPSASAAVPAPTPGVTVTVAGEVVTVAFTPEALAAAQLKAGMTVTGDCESVPHPVGPLLGQDDSDGKLTFGFGSGTVGADGKVALDLAKYLTSGKKPDTAKLDICNVERFDTKETKTVDAAKVALTPAGVAYFEDRTAAAALKAALVRAEQPGSGYRPATAVAGVAALATADATPPAGQVGYWTDGATATVVAVTPSLRRVFVTDAGHQMVRTNLIQQADTLFYGALDALVDDASGGSVDDRGAKDPESDGPGKPPYGLEADPQQYADGIRIAHTGRRVTVRFSGRSAKAYKKIAHRKVRVNCVDPLAEQLVSRRLTNATLPKVGTAVVRAPRTGGKVTATLSRAPGSVCTVSDESALVAIGGLGTAGRHWVQDQQALDLINGVDDAKFVAAGGQTYLPAAQIAARNPKLYVALSGPDAASPVGKVGVWSDGSQRFELVTTSASGRRFIIEDEGGSVARTNVLAAVVAQTVTLIMGIAS